MLGSIFIGIAKEYVLNGQTNHLALPQAGVGTYSEAEDGVEISGGSLS